MLGRYDDSGPQASRLHRASQCFHDASRRAQQYRLSEWWAVSTQRRRLRLLSGHQMFAIWMSHLDPSLHPCKVFHLMSVSHQSAPGSSFEWSPQIAGPNFPSVLSPVFLALVIIPKRKNTASAYVPLHDRIREASKIFFLCWSCRDFIVQSKIFYWCSMDPVGDLISSCIRTAYRVTKKTHRGGVKMQLTDVVHESDPLLEYVPTLSAPHICTCFIRTTYPLFSTLLS